jgi:hypothetical protein
MGSLLLRSFAFQSSDQAAYLLSPILAAHKHALACAHNDQVLHAQQGDELSCIGVHDVAV